MQAITTRQIDKSVNHSELPKNAARIDSYQKVRTKSKDWVQMAIQSLTSDRCETEQAVVNN